VLREFSAGGVLVRTVRGRPMVAAIRPRGKPEGLWALPKGQIDAGESAAETAVREVREETGVSGRLVEKLGDVRYVYTQPAGAGGVHSSGRAASASPTAPPAPGERVFKVVSFFLLRAGRGRIGEIEEEMRIEVADARWLPLDEAPRLLAYGGERQMAAKALERLGA
jgi:8-oxo-dGTP pyrophosphatase MutT (NUDIX family)